MSKKKKKGKSKGTGLTKILFEFLERHPDKAYNFKQIASALDLSRPRWSRILQASG